MADVFISYARADRAPVERLASALHKAGFSVWWDRHISAGEAFARTIEHELNEAKTVIVAWSKNSHFSEWVKDEASFARKHDKLFPVRLDQQEPPLGFRQIQSVDLYSWRGDARDEAFVLLIDSLRSKIDGDGAAKPASVPPVVEQAHFSLPDFLRGRGGVLIAAAFIVAVAAAVFLLRADIGGNRAPEPTIAVLPFANMSANEEDGLFAEGLSEEIIHDLAKIGALRVIGRSYSLSRTDPGASLEDIAEALGVAHVLEGSVRRDGNRLRITIQLVNAENGMSLWSEIYDHTFENIFAIQEDVARSVADALRVEILGAEDLDIRTHASNDPETERLFLIAQARYRAHGLADLTEAARLFQEVLERQPDHGPAAAGYVRTLREQHVRYAHASWGTYIATGRPLLEKVIEKAADDASVRSAYAQLLADEVRDRAGLREILRLPILMTLHGLDPASLADTEREALAAYDRDPKSIDAIETLAFIKLMRRLSPMEEILSLYRKAISIDPLARSAAMGIGDTYFVYGELEKAYSSYAALAELHPDFAPAQLALGYMAPQKEIGLGHFERARQSGGSVFDFNAEAATWFEWGEHEKAVEILSQYDGPRYTKLIGESQILYFQRRYAEMADVYLDMLESSQDRLVAMFAIAALANDDRFEETRDLITTHFPGLLENDSAEIDADNIRILPYAAATLRAEGDLEGADRLCQTGIAYTTRQNLFLRAYYWPTRFVCLAVMGLEDKAIAEFRGAINRGQKYYVIWLPTPVAAPFFDAQILGPLLENDAYRAQVDRLRKINTDSYERYLAAQGSEEN